MTEEQQAVYNKICNETRNKISHSAEETGQKNCAFAAITALKKITCHPQLAGVEDDESDNENYGDQSKKKKPKKNKLTSVKPVYDIKTMGVELSGKLAVLDLLLAVTK